MVRYCTNPSRVLAKDEHNNLVMVNLWSSTMLGDDLLDGANAAATYLGIKPRVIYHMTEAGHLPVIRKGRRLYFRKSELEAAFRSTAA